MYRGVVADGRIVFEAHRPAVVEDAATEVYVSAGDVECVVSICHRNSTGNGVTVVAVHWCGWINGNFRGAGLGCGAGAGAAGSAGAAGAGAGAGVVVAGAVTVNDKPPRATEILSPVGVVSDAVAMPPAGTIRPATTPAVNIVKEPRRITPP